MHAPSNHPWPELEDYPELIGLVGRITGWTDELKVD